MSLKKIAIVVASSFLLANTAFAADAVKPAPDMAQCDQLKKDRKAHKGDKKKQKEITKQLKEMGCKKARAKKQAA